jgi:hypothetical protein
MLKATSSVLSNPRFALTGRHAAMAFSSRMPSMSASASHRPKCWTDVQDELKDLRHLMTEHKTNKAVPALDASVVGRVDDLMCQLDTIDHDEAFQRAHQLKTLVKDALYYHPNHNASPISGGQQRRHMSTAAQHQDMVDTVRRESCDRHWHDIDEEIDQLKHIMEEHKTNHAVNCPHAQLEETVRSNMDEIHHLLSSGNTDLMTHDEAYRRVRLLKNLVKAELYRKDVVNS